MLRGESHPAGMLAEQGVDDTEDFAWGATGLGKAAR